MSVRLDAVDRKPLRRARQIDRLASAQVLHASAQRDREEREPLRHLDLVHGFAIGEQSEVAHVLG